MILPSVSDAIIFEGGMDKAGDDNSHHYIIHPPSLLRLV
jgi:hypothetical protein